MKIVRSFDMLYLLLKDDINERPFTCGSYIDEYGYLNIKTMCIVHRIL